MISDREAFKLSFSSQNIAALLSLLSALFLVSGYLYNRVFLGHFGVEVAKYFSLSDYMAASIEGIERPLVATFVGCLGAILGAILGARSVRRMSHAQARKARIHLRIQMFLFIAGLCGLVIFAYFRDSALFYVLAALFIVVLSNWLVNWLVRRYFESKNWILVHFLVVSTLAFLLYTFAFARAAVHRIEHGRANDLKQYAISFKEPIVLNSENLMLLAANSGYLFLRDTSSGNVYIVPADRIQFISVRGERGDQEN